MLKKWLWREFAETLGAIGVIASLIFVALEIRQNTTAVRSQAHQGVQDQIDANLQLLVGDPTLLEIVARGMADESSLSPEENRRFQSYWMMTLQQYQNLYFQVREGAYDPQLAEGWWQQLRNNFETRGVQHYWEQRNYLLSADFRQFVETEVMTRQPTSGFTPFDTSTR